MLNNLTDLYIILTIIYLYRKLGVFLVLLSKINSTDSNNN